MILSSQVLSSPKCCRMALTCSKANLSLGKDKDIKNEPLAGVGGGCGGTNSARNSSIPSHDKNSGQTTPARFANGVQMTVTDHFRSLAG